MEYEARITEQITSKIPIRGRIPNLILFLKIRLPEIFGSKKKIPPISEIADNVTIISLFLNQFSFILN